jgi:hypothetical protein
VGELDFAAVYEGYTRFYSLPTLADAGLFVTPAAHPLDLKQLEQDDDINGIDVQPKLRPITDSLIKPVNTKNKSQVLVEAVADQQLQWRDKQRKGVYELAEKLTGLNGLMRGTSLSLLLDGLLEYMKQ